MCKSAPPPPPFPQIGEKSSLSESDTKDWRGEEREVRKEERN